MARKRLNLVPSDAVECFEIRCTLYFDNDANARVGFEISTPDDPHTTPPLHEVLGVLRFAEATIIEQYDKEPE